MHLHMPVWVRSNEECRVTAVPQPQDIMRPLCGLGLLSHLDGTSRIEAALELVCELVVVPLDGTTPSAVAQMGTGASPYWLLRYDVDRAADIVTAFVAHAVNATVAVVQLLRAGVSSPAFAAALDARDHAGAPTGK